MLKVINNEEFITNIDEFVNVPIEGYESLNILSNLGFYERIISLLSELTKIFEYKINLLYEGASHGGYVAIKIADKYNNINLINSSDIENINANIKNYNIGNILFNTDSIFYNHIVFFENDVNIREEHYYSPILNIKLSVKINDKYRVYKLSNTDFFIHIPEHLYNNFLREFHYFIKENDVLDYDNLIHFTMIVKDAGDDFEKVLLENLPIIDRWTILDTGSTDNTIAIINKVLVGKKKGQLYREPFVNFRDTRNRCLDLAGKECKFAIMLDDTYVTREDLRTFLNEIRGDQYSTSFSLYVSSHDMQYTSNRITKTYMNLRYKYKIHEIIQPENNNNVLIPINKSFIYDYSNDYMEKRTMDRKQYDLDILFESYREDPNDSRSLYYLGQTYNLIEKYELAYEYFMKRIEHHNEGFIQEKIDACFELARICNFKLNKPWKECEKLYMRAYEMDKSRPDSLYYIGIHYYYENNFQTAYTYMKAAFEIGYPLNSQFSLKPTLSFYFLPKILTELCFYMSDYDLGFRSSSLFLEKNNDDNSTEYYIVKCWYKIYRLLNSEIINNYNSNTTTTKPILCFVVDGGFEKWSGKDILSKGVGGSETFIIEIAKYLQESDYFNVFVFCNCETNEKYLNVEYRKLEEYKTFITLNKVHTSIISRYPEYLPVTYNNVENVYLILHDLIPDGEIMIDNSRLHNVFCLSDYHSNLIKNMYRSLENKITTFGYGIDYESFNNLNGIQKIKNKFIYSSFPNRGLLKLLQLWPRIIERYPDATLHIHSDVNGKWVNNVVPHIVKEIKSLLEISKNIVYHGWTSKKILYENWLSSDIWFYPTNFIETFCLTAVEAAVSKTLVVTTNVGALINTVGNNGILIDGYRVGDDENEWDNNALETLFKIMDEPQLKQKYINLNYNWYKNITWRSRTYELLDKYLIPTITTTTTSTTTEEEQHKNVDTRLNYKNMYNWTNDLPNNTKKIFDDVLKYFNFKNNTTTNLTNILEIGVYTGTSLIKILETVPNSIGHAIDKWEDYEEDFELLRNIKINNIENIFNENVVKANLKDRILVHKGDSTEVLLNMSKEFDLIYVDGSHKCLDCYADMILSFNLLKKGGIMIVDDVLYRKGDIINSPFESVEHFINKYKNNIIIMNNGYRLFLEKI